MVPFGTLCRTSWGRPAYSFLETESGVSKHRFQVAGRDGPAHRQNREIQQNPAPAITPDISGYPKGSGTGSPTAIHISVTSRCKSVVRLYQQSAIRSKRKMADEAFLHLIVGCKAGTPQAAKSVTAYPRPWVRERRYSCPRGHGTGTSRVPDRFSSGRDKEQRPRPADAQVTG